ncbi:hybrid sensor histidine kinase/response regulator [Leptospira idonii]|uniref:hybrid sensor histidine kinase/response regulator n=1 Tax=Leptospira idonii TaxID=1193500 RepID=UPI0014383889|nr:ATP-binding protein [Leptospira idonii]
MDAENWNISKDRLELRGDWRFFWKQFLDPKEEDPSSVVFATSSNHWTKIVLDGENLPSFGWATYRLDLKLPDTKEDLALAVPVLHTAYRLYIDGELIHENGKVAEDPSLHKPSYHTHIFPLKRKNQIIQIQIHISNYTHRIAGMKELIRVGSISGMYQDASNTLVSDWFIIILLVILAVYHFGIYWLRKAEIASFYLGLLYLGIVMMLFTLTESRILFNAFSDEWCVPLIRFSKFWLPINLYTGGSVLYHLFLSRKLHWILNILIGYASIAAIITIFFPIAYTVGISHYLEMVSVFFMFIGVCFSLYAVATKQKNSVLYLFSFLAACGGATFDLLYFANYIPGLRPAGAYSLVPFLIPQTIILTRSIIHIFRREEDISRELIRSKEDLEEKVKERTSELEKANRWKANFVSLISHDLRSPLNGVNQILDVVRFNFESMPDMEKKRFLHLCKEGIQNSLRMLKQLLDVSRFDSEGIRLQQTQFSIQNLLSDVFHAIEPIAAVKDIQINFKLSHDVSLIADRALLEEVFKNLLTNSIKYSHPKSKIDVVQTVKGDWISVEVRDYGIGMDEEQISKVLGDAASKSHPGTHGELGTGLGLKLCQNILEAHFSKLRVKSELGAGSRFEVMLSNSTKSILLVDDSDSFRAELAEELRRNKWIVIEARNGEEALDHLSRILPAIIVTDKEMPIMDGVSFLHEWEGRKGSSKIPVILVSSAAPFSGGKKFLEEEGIAGYAEMYVSKLFRKEQLVELIESVLK